MEINKNEYSDESNLKISEAVIAKIATTAATDVAGVASLASSSASQSVKRALGIKGEAKGVSISVAGGEVVVDLFINVLYGVNVKATAEAVQANVRSAIENMTGMIVAKVDVAVVGLVFDTENKGKQEE